MSSEYCLKKLTFCKISLNPKLDRWWKFQLSILTNKKVFFLKKKIWIVPCKVLTFWETHKIWKIRLYGFDKSADLLSKRQNHEKDFFKLCVLLKETKGRSSGQTPFTLKPKLALKKQQFSTPQKYFSNFCKKKFTFVSSTFLVQTLQCKKKKFKKEFCPWKHKKNSHQKLLIIYNQQFFS